MQQREVNDWCKQIYDHEDLHPEQIFLSLDSSIDLTLYSNEVHWLIDGETR